MSKHIQTEVQPWIPGQLLPIRLSQIGISKRLRTVLASIGKHFVGDVHNLSANDLLKVDRRGIELMAELVDAIQTLAALAQSLNSSSTDPPGHTAEPAAPPRPGRSYRKGSPGTANSASLIICISSLQNQNGPLPAPPNVAQLLSALENRLSRLTPRDLKIIELRFGANQ